VPSARYPFRCLPTGIALTLTLALALAAMLPQAASADQGDPLIYYGGPVVHSVTGIVVDWGPRINPLYTNPTTGDPGLIKYFASQSGSPDDIGGVLAQYMDSSGQNSANQVTYGGQFQINPTIGASTVQDAQVASQLVAQIGSGALPTPPGNGVSTVYIVLFPAGTTICDESGCSGQAFCSYHGSTQLPNGTSVLYTVIPDNTAGAMTQGCGTESTLQNQTMYLSHEWSESIDDPLVDDATALAPPLAWYDANCPASTSACGEVADKCNQQPTTDGGWTVQLLWSNIDDACVGAEDRYGTPSVAFNPPSGLAPGQPATFPASATDPPGNTASVSFSGQQYSIQAGIANLSWSWGDGSPGSDGPDPSHAFASPGIYNVTLTATDNLGFTSSTTQAVDVWGPLGAPVSRTGAPSHVSASTATVTGTVDPANLSVGYRFDYGEAPTQLSDATAIAPAPVGAGGGAVSATLTGLKPATTYFYRLDAVIAAQLLPGAVESFRTAARRRTGSAIARAASAGRRRRNRRRRLAATRARQRHTKTIKTRAVKTRAVKTHTPSASAVRSEPLARQAPARQLQVGVVTLGRRRLALALARGLRVRFDCPGPCRVHLLATLELHGVLSLVAVPRALASGDGRSRAGAGTAVLRFSSSARAWLAASGSASFAVSGFELPASV